MNNAHLFTFHNHRHLCQLQAPHFSLKLVPTRCPSHVPFIDLGLQNFVGLLLVLMKARIVFSIPHLRIQMAEPICFLAHTLW